MDNNQLRIFQITQAMFNAAPGAHFLNEFTKIVDNVSGSTNALANILAQTDVFKQAMYSDTLTNKEFSTQFVENTVGSLVSKGNKDLAASALEAMLAEGQSRGDVIHWAATILAAVDTTDTNWGAAALQFDNKVDVASFYSIDQSGPASTLSILQQVTADVTNIAASVSDAKALFESGVSGNVIDGYVSGATVFVDLNGDGVLNEGEVSTTTDKFGNFTFSSGATAFGNLISFGGTDIATKTPFEGVMTAPAGSSVVNPLTTLIDKITQDGTTSVDQAATKVVGLLNLDPDVNLLNFDPIAEMIRTDTDSTATNIALVIQAAAVKVNTLIGQTAALLSGSGVSADENVGIELAYTALASLLRGANATNTIDLASSTIIGQVIQDATEEGGASAAQITVIAGLSSDASQVISNLNTAINNAVTSGSNTSNTLTQIAAIQIVAESIEVIMNSGAAVGDVSNAISSTTGATFNNAIEAAESRVGDVDGDGTPDHIFPPGTNVPGTQFLATNTTAFTGTSLNDVLSISTSASFSPLVMTAVTLNGGAGTNTLRMQDTSSIAAATVSNFTELTFDATGVTGTNDATMTATQYTGFTGTITATGTGANGENIILSNALTGAATLNAAVENFTLAAGTNSVTVGAVGQTINADALTDGQVLTLAGTQAATVTLVAGDLTSTSSGDTTVTATTGSNVITTGSGADTITAGTGNDTITGGAGIDTITLSGGTNTIQDLGAGGSVDVVDLNGGTVTSTATGAWTASASTDNGGANAAAFTINVASAGAVSLASAGTSAAGYTVVSTGTSAVTGSDDADTLTNTSGNVSMTGGAGIDTFTATADALTITDLGAGGLVDIVDLNGGTVSATTTGAWTASASTDNGGANAAAFTINVASAGAVNLASAGTSAAGYTVVSTGTSAVTGSDDADTLTNTSGNASMTGGAGIDTFTATADALTITDLGAGNVADIVTVASGATVAATVTGNWTASSSTQNLGSVAADFAISVAGTNTVNLANATVTTAATDGFQVTSTGTGAITGSDGNDTLTGGTGDGTFTGGAGVDTITGGAGSDTLNGGTGADVYNYTATTDGSTTPGSGDVIATANFVTTSDKLQFTDAAFGSIGTGNVDIDTGTVAFNTDQGTTLTDFTTAAGTDRAGYTIELTGSTLNGTLYDAIDTAAAAGAAATGAAFYVIDNGTDTVVLYDSAAETAGAGTLVEIVTITGLADAVGGLANGDLVIA